MSRLSSVCVLVPLPAMAPAGDRLLDSPLVAVVVVAALSLLGFAVVMLTSFVKVAVVLSVLRSALGTPQVPPTLVITGLAFVLAAYVMAPVVRQTVRVAEPEVEQINRRGGSTSDQVKRYLSAGKKAAGPLRGFLKKHAHSRDRASFLALARRLHEPRDRAKIHSDDFLVLVPAFLTSELKEAFIIGFFLFVPFLVIDLVVGNILLALGMHMLSPTTISLPFKFLLFVLVDGWHLLTRGLIAGYL